MNKFWVRLSAAFITVTALTALILFSVSFGLSWLPSASISDPAEYQDEYDFLTWPVVEDMIIAGYSDSEIITLLETDDRLPEMIEDARNEGYAPNVDAYDYSASRIIGDYFAELLNRDTLLTLLIGSVFGVLASIFLSRQLVRPLAELTQASKALGQNDLSQRVTVQGSAEVNDLAANFNAMAAQLEENENTRQNMLADISHELRTPLSGLDGTLRATLDGVFEVDQTRIGQLHQQTQHLSRLVDDLHLLARADAKRLPLNKTDVDLGRALAQLADVFRVLADDAEITLEIDFANVPTVSIDEIRLRQIVSNLLNNALRHTPSDGTIKLMLRQTEGKAEISVSDTGEGIDPEHLAQLFDRFYRVDKSRSRDTGGTGLGLAITRALVEAHDGEITAESAGKGKGASFRVYLPIEN